MSGIELLGTFSDIRFLDQTGSLDHPDALWNHAMDEAIARMVAKKEVPATVRCWRYDRSVMLGRRDMRLLDIDAAIEWMRKQGFDVAVRPSGGTCVPLDHGVLNISIILPAADYRNVTLDDGFRVMAQLIRESLQPIADVQAGEVLGSYCPGDYDLSISGFKIAGIAQRRIMGAVMIQAFLLIQGSGSERFQFIQEMYERAGLYQTPLAQRPLPSLRENSLQSIEELIRETISPQAVSDFLYKTIQKRDIQVTQGTITQKEIDLTFEERDRFKKQLQLLCFGRY